MAENKTFGDLTAAIAQAVQGVPFDVAYSALALVTENMRVTLQHRYVENLIAHEKAQQAAQSYSQGAAVATPPAASCEGQDT